MCVLESVNIHSVFVGTGTKHVFVKDMEQSLYEGLIVDYWKKGDAFECVQVNHIQDICDQV